MKMKLNFKSPKILKLDRQQSRTLIIVTVATIISVFCLLSSKALWSQAIYNRHVLGARRRAANQLKANLDSLNTLKSQYEVFNSANPNALGGRNLSDPNAIPPDGDNTRIVLDALPVSYDFAALISSITKIMSLNGISNPGIAAADESATIKSTTSSHPQPVEIPLSVNGASSYGGTQNLIHDFENSIRPFDITRLQLSGNSSEMSISMSLTTYFQPAKSLSTGSQEIK